MSKPKTDARPLDQLTGKTMRDDKDPNLTVTNLDHYCQLCNRNIGEIKIHGKTPRHRGAVRAEKKARKMRLKEVKI